MWKNNLGVMKSGTEIIWSRRKARYDKIHAPASTQPVHEQVHKFDIAFCLMTVTGMGLMSSDNKDSECGRNMINR